MSKRSTARNKELEALHSKVNPTGEGEDPAVRALLSEQFVQGSNKEALDIALELQKIVRGQNSILENQEQFSDQMNRLRERMDKMDEAAVRWETDRESFITEVMDKAEKLVATGLEKDRIIAKGSNQMVEAVNNARAEQVTEHLKFEQELAKMPRVTVVSAGELTMVMEGGRQVARIMNETVKIKNHKWVLPAGKAIEVPLVVAQVLEERRRLQAETALREKLLSSNVESSIFNQKWQEINAKFNSTTDTVPNI